MRKKQISKTYLRGVSSYDFNLFVRSDWDFYVSVKHIHDIDNPFILEMDGKMVCLIDKGYYLVEFVPKNANYAVRVYVNKDKEILEYYFDISLENGIDPESRIPFYSDLYLDVTYYNGKISLLDETELKDALKNNLINKSEFDLAYKVAQDLIKELKDGRNKFVNMDVLQFIRD